MNTYLHLTWHFTATGVGSGIDASIWRDEEMLEYHLVADFLIKNIDRDEAQADAIEWAAQKGWHKAGRWSGPRHDPQRRRSRWVRVAR